MKREGLLVSWLYDDSVLPQFLIQALHHWPYIEPMVRRPVSEADYDGMILLLIEIKAVIGPQKNHVLASLESHLEYLLEKYDQDFRV